MKVIIFGATGFVGQEILRQASALPSVTSVVSVGRRAVAESSSSSKVKSVVMSDWLKYTDEVKKDLANADACIWTIGVTPRHLRNMSFEEVRKICLDYTTTALDVLAAEPRKSPLRFIYMSGSAATRKVEDKPWVLGNYSQLRGEVENKVIEYETSQPDRIKAFVVKPGVIQSATRNDGIITKIAHTFLAPLIGLPTIPLPEAAASTLALAVDGSEEQTLLNADMQKVGAAFIAKHGLA